ncbi:hypothetical protein [Terrabacter carboxydivorans]|uniref:Uncharacterized protein n=1 Tax=Terrabacter carboxydivorans TaxID=619730 RepID=A0ABN3KTX9_9MICO
MAALTELFADDAAWHMPGGGSLSGTKQGRMRSSFFGELMTRSEGSLVVVTPDDVVGGDSH